MLGLALAGESCFDCTTPHPQPVLSPKTVLYFFLSYAKKSSLDENANASQAWKCNYLGR